MVDDSIRVHHDTVIQYHQMRFRRSPAHALLPMCVAGCFAGLLGLRQVAAGGVEAMLLTGWLAVCVIGVAVCFHRLRRGVMWFVVDAEPEPHGGRRTHEEVRRGVKRWAAASWILTMMVVGTLALQFVMALGDAALPDAWKLFTGAMAALSGVSLVALFHRRRVILADEIVKGMADPRIQRAAREA